MHTHELQIDSNVEKSELKCRHWRVAHQQQNQEKEKKTTLYTINEEKKILITNDCYLFWITHEIDEKKQKFRRGR